MTELTPSYLEGACTSAQEDRLIADDLICTDGVAKVADGSLLVAAGAAGITVDVAEGGCFIRGTDPSASQQGTYHCFNDDTVNRALAANASGNPRVDQIIARVYDSEYAGSTDAWAIEALTGTPTSGANLTNLNGAAALPDNSIRLAYVLVPTGATLPGQLTIQDERDPFTFCSENTAVGSALIATVVFTTTGNFTKASYPKGSKIRIRCIGSGGGGGGSEASASSNSSAGAGGGSGGYSEAWVPFSSLATSETVTIPNGGAGNSAAVGSAGSPCTFGAFCRANGGSGGGVLPTSTTSNAIHGGAGASVTSAVGDVKMPGAPGGMAMLVGPTRSISGDGGSSVLGGGAVGQHGGAAGNAAVANTGGGGGGALSDETDGNRAGGAGGSGICIVEVFG
jgi:hypothetical protein